MKTYRYLYRDKQGKVIQDHIEARQSYEALHNARIKVFMQGGDIRGLVITQ